jgi:hypothetical protein
MKTRTRISRFLWDAALSIAVVFAATGAAAQATKPMAAATRTAATAPATSTDPDLIARWTATRADERGAADLVRPARLAKPPAAAKVVVEETAGRKGFRIQPGGGGLVVADDPVLNFTADFTASVWLKLATDQGAVYVLSKRAEDGTDGWAIVHGINGIGGVGFVASPRVVVPTPVKAFDTWVHVAVTFHDKSFLLYVDGKAIGITDLPSVPLPSKAPLVIGAGAGGKKGMDGWLDDVRIYHRALSAADVEALAAGKEPPNPYVKLTTAEATAVRDAVKQLGSDVYKQREAAAARLREMGRKIFPMLREYRDSEDLEVASRIRAILGELPRGAGDEN